MALCSERAEEVRTINNMSNVFTARGRARVWIRMTLMNKRLHHHLSAAVDDHQLLRCVGIVGVLCVAPAYCCRRFAVPPYLPVRLCCAGRCCSRGLGGCLCLVFR